MDQPHRPCNCPSEGGREDSGSCASARLSPCRFLAQAATPVPMTSSASGGGGAGRPRLRILGVALDAGDAADARARLRAFLVEPWDGRCRHLVTLNPEYVMAARRDPAFAQAIEEADLVTADGVGVAVAARLTGGRAGRRVRRVTGVDFVEWLAAESGPRAAPLFLLGAGQGVAEAAGRELRRRYPAARIGGWWSEGTPRPVDDAETLARIRASGAHAVVVAYGAPGQVHWIHRNRDDLAAARIRVAVGVGGALDYLAGAAPRAPAAVRWIGLEWLYRLVREPWRWRRQLVLPVFAARVALEWLWRRGNRGQEIGRLK